MATEKGAVKAILRHHRDSVKLSGSEGWFLILLATWRASAYLKAMDRKGQRPFLILTRTSPHEYDRNQPYFR